MSNTIPDITVCLPCYGRPLRTRRMMECIAAQTKRNFEIILVGDGCPDFTNMLSDPGFKKWLLFMQSRGHHVCVIYSSVNMGGHGAGAVNKAIEHATGRYFCFVNNDDILAPEHVEFYYNSIEHYNKSKPSHIKNAKFVFNRTMLNSGHGFFERKPELRFGCVGHSELVIDTTFLKSMPPHQPVYGQDWVLIQNMMGQGYGTAGETPFPTYFIMGTPSYQETGID